MNSECCRGSDVLLARAARTSWSSDTNQILSAMSIKIITYKNHGLDTNAIFVQHLNGVWIRVRSPVVQKISKLMIIVLNDDDSIAIHSSAENVRWLYGLEMASDT